MGCCYTKQDPYSVYIDIIRKKKIDKSNKIYPDFTVYEKETLSSIYDKLPRDAQNIITINTDDGAGTGIR